ncbi:hypothetical protein [Nocardioides sp. W7]|uniref:hypothetical protein n=1 Tax=Nocardioides sp. W7 TaxID=2931390 RepID=UPI001FD2825F|nr:hypothetical protein [Nocardioides sp. W7]
MTSQPQWLLEPACCRQENATDRALGAAPRPTSYARWAAESPDDSVFAITSRRYVTHRLRLPAPFFELLSRTTQAIAEFARRHDDKRLRTVRGAGC